LQAELKLFKLFERSKNNYHYPLMRDPLGNPRCYEMTNEERLAALARSDELLKQRVENHVPNYFGA
jgi:hypothetical protein